MTVQPTSVITSGSKERGAVPTRYINKEEIFAGIKSSQLAAVRQGLGLTDDTWLLALNFLDKKSKIRQYAPFEKFLGETEKRLEYGIFGKVILEIALIADEYRGKNRVYRPEVEDASAFMRMIESDKKSKMKLPLSTTDLLALAVEAENVSIYEKPELVIQLEDIDTDQMWERIFTPVQTALAVMTTQAAGRKEDLIQNVASFSSIVEVLTRQNLHWLTALAKIKPLSDWKEEFLVAGFDYDTLIHFGIERPESEVARRLKTAIDKKDETERERIISQLLSADQTNWKAISKAEINFKVGRFIGDHSHLFVNDLEMLIGKLTEYLDQPLITSGNKSSAIGRGVASVLSTAEYEQIKIGEIATSNLFTKIMKIHKEWLRINTKESSICSSSQPEESGWIGLVRELTNGHKIKPVDVNQREFDQYVEIIIRRNHRHRESAFED